MSDHLIGVNRLMLCAGIHKREGWKTLDANPTMKPDYVVTLPYFPAGMLDRQWDEIEWVHGVGSLVPWEASATLALIRIAMITADGLLVLEQPDVRHCLAYAIETGNVAWLFGDPTHKDLLIMNRWCYSPDQLAAMLRECGWSRIEIKPAQYHNPARDFRIEARP